MSLKLWLPLNKDYRNIGLIDSNVSISGNAPIESDSKKGACCSFYGQESLNVTGFDPSNLEELTITFWYKSHNSNIIDNVFLFRKNTTHQLRVSNGTFSFRDTQNSSQKQLQFGDVETNTWTHVAVVYNRGSVYLYKNGVLVNSFVPNTTATLNSGINEFSIGVITSTNGTTYLNGSLFDFRIYTHELDKLDIERLYSAPLFNLVAVSGAVETLFDKSGYCFGTYNRKNIYTAKVNQYIKTGNTVVQSVIDFRADKLTFYTSGSTKNRIYINNFNICNNEKTINIWFLKDDFQSARADGSVYSGETMSIMDFEESRTETLVVTDIKKGKNGTYISTPVLKFFIGGNLASIVVEEIYNLNQWNMLTLVTNNKGYGILINGNVVISEKALMPSLQSVKLHISETLSTPFKGFVYETKIFNYAMNNEDVLKLYNENWIYNKFLSTPKHGVSSGGTLPPIFSGGTIIK